MEIFPAIIYITHKMSQMVAKTSKVYYRGKYWNDYKIVKEYMNQQLTGDKNVWWMLDFQKRYQNKPFKKALFLNCGDGRHERKFMTRKIVKHVISFDYLESLLKKARRLSKGKNIEYFQADANTINFPKNSFDLVVNIAALHHIQYLNRMCRIIADSLKPDGVFMSFDYIGPSRNQYSRFQWNLTKKINSSLPEKIKKDKLYYPHIPTMMATDPTEAIHSSMIMEMVGRYFEFIHQKNVGGGVAYTLLSQNPKMDKLNKSESEKIVKKILKIDDEYTKKGLLPDMFTYFIAKPKKEILKNKKFLKKYQDEEDLREALATVIENTNSVQEYLYLIPHGRQIKRAIKRTARLGIYLTLKSLSQILPVSFFKQLIERTTSLKIDVRGEYS